MTKKKYTPKPRFEIKDELIHPYYILVDDVQFTLYKYTKGDKPDNAIGYYTSLSPALKKIAKQLVLDKNTSEYKTLKIKEFVDAYKKICDDLTETFKDIKITY